MRLRYLGVVALLFSTSVALGDGCYMPERAVRKIPAIVAQRAVLSWKDGVETLVISSALDSEAQKLGWIIPVPAVPEKIEKETPGGLKTLEFCIQPQITHDLYLEVRATIVAVLLANLLLAVWLFKRKRFVELVVWLLWLFILTALLLPALGAVRAGAVTKASAVQVEKTATVGSYTINILRPSRADGLNTWLDGNGFARLPEAASGAIAGYISQGWVFAAIKLTRGESGLNAPHPIKLVFTAKEAVYPMKLTAVAGGRPEFELFVIGDDRAACDTLKLEFCDRFTKFENDRWPETEPTSWSFRGRNSRCEVGHAAICSLMWDDCVLTKFAGSVDAAGMTKDIRFAWEPFKPHQEHFFTPYGARCLAAICFFLMAGGWNMVSMGAYARGRIQPKRFKWYFVKGFLPAIACATIAAGTCFAVLPKLGDSDFQVAGRWYGPQYLSSPYVEERWSEYTKLLGGPRPPIVNFVREELYGTATEGTSPRNPVTGAELQSEDSPGNFTIEKQADKVFVRIYDGSGRASVNAFPIGGTGNPGQPDSPAGTGPRVKL